MRGGERDRGAEKEEGESKRDRERRKVDVQRDEEYPKRDEKRRLRKQINNKAVDFVTRLIFADFDPRIPMASRFLLLC